MQLPELYYAGSHGMDIMGPASGCKGHKSQGKKMSDDKVVLIFLKSIRLEVPFVPSLVVFYLTQIFSYIFMFYLVGWKSNDFVSTCK